MTNLTAIELNIQLNASLIDQLNEAMQLASSEQLEQLMLLVKMRRLAINEFMLDKCKEYDSRINTLCEFIINS